jgi:hypothetical protein
MTEQDWLEATDPLPMLDFLKDKTSERKLRLFSVACCRRFWPFLKEECSKAALEVVERWVEGKASVEELLLAHEFAWQVRGTPARTAVCDASKVQWYPGSAGVAASHAAWAGVGRSRADECKVQAVLLRDIVGNPFHPPPLIPASVLQWSADLVPRLAEEAYQHRLLPAGHLDPDRLAVLADALEEAGCPDQDILGHLRQQGAAHVRGCHVVDLLTDRK